MCTYSRVFSKMEILFSVFKKKTASTRGDFDSYVQKSEPAIIVFENLRICLSTRIRQVSVFKSFHFGERIENLHFRCPKTPATHWVESIILTLEALREGSNWPPPPPLDVFGFLKIVAPWPIGKSFDTTVPCLWTQFLMLTKWRHKWWRHRKKSRKLCVDCEISIFR